MKLTKVQRITRGIVYTINDLIVLGIITGIIPVYLYSLMLKLFGA